MVANIFQKKKVLGGTLFKDPRVVNSIAKSPILDVPGVSSCIIAIIHPPLVTVQMYFPGDMKSKIFNRRIASIVIDHAATLNPNQILGISSSTNIGR